MEDIRSAATRSPQVMRCLRLMLTLLGDDERRRMAVEEEARETFAESIVHQASVWLEVRDGSFDAGVDLDEDFDGLPDEVYAGEDVLPSGDELREFGWEPEFE